MCSVIALCTGYEGYTGYYADGTAYSYDPAGYPATAAPSGAVDSAHTTESGAAVAGPAEQTVVGQTIAGPVAADSAMPQGQTAVDNYGMEPIVGLLTSDEKAHLEQQQEEADIARQEAEQRLRDAEEKRQNARVMPMLTCTDNRSICLLWLYCFSCKH